jgi:hypothetical protein
MTVIMPSPHNTSETRCFRQGHRLRHAVAALPALLLCGTALGCAQPGSLAIIAHRPAAGARHLAAEPAWISWCTRGKPRRDRKRLAFCARVEGRAIDSTHGPGRLEAHVALLGYFHVVLVRLPEGARTPANGARVVAIGPLFRARDGLREVQAFWFDAYDVVTRHRRPARW